MDLKDTKIDSITVYVGPRPSADRKASSSLPDDACYAEIWSKPTTTPAKVGTTAVQKRKRIIEEVEYDPAAWEKRDDGRWHPLKRTSSSPVIREQKFVSLALESTDEEDDAEDVTVELKSRLRREGTGKRKQVVAKRKPVRKMYAIKEGFREELMPFRAVDVQNWVSYGGSLYRCVGEASFHAARYRNRFPWLLQLEEPSSPDKPRRARRTLCLDESRVKKVLVVCQEEEGGRGGGGEKIITSTKQRDCFRNLRTDDTAEEQSTS
jgi:hypothetical protein